MSHMLYEKIKHRIFKVLYVFVLLGTIVRCSHAKLTEIPKVNFKTP